MTIEEFTAHVLEQQKAMYAAKYSQWQADDLVIEVHYASKYARVDFGPSHNIAGHYMVEIATGTIYGIKGYGKVHKGHFYGTLDTVSEWYWGDYYPEKKPLESSLCSRASRSRHPTAMYGAAGQARRSTSATCAASSRL
jgi:hypothetical protein